MGAKMFDGYVAIAIFSLAFSTAGVGAVAMSIALRTDDIIPNLASRLLIGLMAVIGGWIGIFVAAFIAKTIGWAS